MVLLIHINRTTEQNWTSCAALGWPGWPRRALIGTGSSWSKSMYTELRTKLRAHKKNYPWGSKRIKGLVSDFHTKAGHNLPALGLIKSNSMLQREKGNYFRDLNLSVWHQASTLPQMKYDMCVKYPTEAGKL